MKCLSGCSCTVVQRSATHDNVMWRNVVHSGLMKLHESSTSCTVFAPLRPRRARRQPAPGAAMQASRGSQPGPARASQGQPGPARASQRQPGPARASQGQPEGSRRAQGRAWGHTAYGIITCASCSSQARGVGGRKRGKGVEKGAEKGSEERG